MMIFWWCSYFQSFFNFQLFVNTFTLTFIAEWGDRSQLATIVLAGINDVVRNKIVAGYQSVSMPINLICVLLECVFFFILWLQVGVILGGCLGHAICTGGAVLAGALIARSSHHFFSSYHLVPLIICLHIDITILGSYFFLALFMFRFISIRKITFLGALVFLGFAIASIFIDPNEDGIDGIPDIQVATKFEWNIKFDNLKNLIKNWWFYLIFLWKKYFVW